MSAVPLLSVRDLNVFARDGNEELVKSISFSVEAGRTLGLVGQSGSGKTLGAMAVAGLLPANVEARGKIILEGTDLTALNEPAARRLRTARLGVVFQNPMTALNPRMTVGAQLIEAHSRDLRRDRAASVQRALRLLDDVGIARAAERLNAYPHELSGGLAQRVVIALALARSPRLLIADEPTTALDVTVQAQILDLIDRLRLEHRFGVLLITHDMGIIRDRSDKVAVMSGGGIVEAGETMAVFDRPVTPEAKALVGATRAMQFRSSETRSGAVAPVHFLLRAENIRKRFGHSQSALDGVSLSVAQGGTTGIVGESGSGKTTLARILVGLERKDGGKLFFNAIERQSGARPSDIQYVFQDPYSSLSPCIRILDTVAEPLLVRGDRKQAAYAKARELLAEVDLDPSLWEKRPTHLSGGQRQRVGIARAIATGPRLLIADEPVAALDATARDRILDLLERLRLSRNMALLLISHDLSVVAKLCSDVVVMRSGEIVEQGPTRRVFENPTHPYTRQLIDAIPGRARQDEQHQNLNPAFALATA